MTTPQTITANGATWTLLEMRGGDVVYRRGKATRTFDPWELSMITGPGLDIVTRTGKRTEWRVATNDKEATHV